MRYGERIQTREPQEPKLSKGNFSKQVLICILLLIFCVGAKFYPDGRLDIVKNSVNLIVNKNTDIATELGKIKSYFLKDREMKKLNPVSELVPPSLGEVVKGFGIQDAAGSGFHYGVDISAKENENIVASGAGKVIEIATNSEYGTYIVIEHSEDISTLYGNLNEVLPNLEDRVEKGQAIARAGGENSTFYFELRRGDTYLDPTQFIEFGETKND